MGWQWDFLEEEWLGWTKNEVDLIEGKVVVSQNKIYFAEGRTLVSRVLRTVSRVCTKNEAKMVAGHKSSETPLWRWYDVIW